MSEDNQSVEELAKKVKELQEKSETRFYIAMGGVLVALILSILCFFVGKNADEFILKKIAEMHPKAEKSE